MKTRIVKIDSGNIYNKKFRLEHSKSFFVYANGKCDANFEFKLVSPYVLLNVYVLLVGDNDDLVNFKVKIIHQSSHTSSKIEFRSVAKDRANISYTGIIRVNAKASDANAFLKGDNLLMGDAVTVSSSPELEILCSSAKASHGVATHTVDDEAIVYLESRGLSRKTSESLYIKGFVDDIINRAGVAASINPF